MREVLEHVTLGDLVVPRMLNPTMSIGFVITGPVPRVLLVGAYERDNFGDLLFLLVTERYVTGWLEGPVNVIHDGALARAWLIAREDGGPIEPAPPTRVVGGVDSARFRDDLVAALVSPLP